MSKPVDERVMEQEIEKADKLIVAAQQQLDGAKQSKASQSTIEHLEQRVKALATRKARFTKSLAKLKPQPIGKQTKAKKSTAPSSGKTDEPKEKAGDE